MKKHIPTFLALAAGAAIVAGGVVLFNSKSQRHAHEAGPVMLPVVADARLLSAGHVRLTVPVVADVQALHDSVIASRLLAYVTALPLFEGAKFKRGDLLARLDMTPAGAGQAQGNSLVTELAGAESNLKTEQERLHRAQALYRIQGVSQEQVQAAEAAFAGARSRHTIARENLHGASVRAPFDGVVSQRLAQPGDLVTPGKPLLKIINSAAGNRLLVNVPETVQPAGLIIGDDILPLTPWPEAGAQGLRRFEARSRDGALLPGARIGARLLVFRSPEAVLLARDCLLNDDGQTATVLALKGEDASAVAPPSPANPALHGEPRHHQQSRQATPHPSAPQQGGHDARRQSSAAIEPIRVTLASQGEEGAVAADTRLAGRRVVCGSPDLLSRLMAGTPFTIQSAKE